MNVYLYQNNTEKILKNAYIGKVIEYDFTTGDQWWTRSTEIQRSSSWLYVNTRSVSWYVSAPSQIYSGTPKKITINFSRTDTMCWIRVEDSTTSNWYFLPRWYSLQTRFDWDNWWTITQNTLSSTLGTWNLTWEMNINSSTTNWTITHKITWCNPITDTWWVLKTLWANKTFCLWLVCWENPNQPFIKSIVFEY